MIGRTITLALCAGAFWLGMEFQKNRLTSACTAASGTTNIAGLCVGARP